jgi:signal transduction histidine kinase
VSTLEELPREGHCADCAGGDIDELCELAALICDAPVAGAQLPTPDGFAMVAWHGAPPPAGRSLSSTPCAGVLATGQPLVIEDLSDSTKPDGARWELGELRAYAGVPIANAHGRPVGTVCVFDTAVRGFDGTQLRGLELLARQVGRAVELARSTREADAATRERASAMAQLEEAEQRFRVLAESTLARTQRASERAQADLEARNAELQALARTKDMLRSAISREFRTPLSSITTFLRLLTAEDDLSETQQQAVAVIARNAERLNRLVVDLLNIEETPSALETTIEAIDLREVATEAVEAAAQRARDAGVELRAEPGEPVPSLGDACRLAQAIDSLLDNALKFTDSDGEITVTATSTPEGAVLEVADTGVGIEASELGRVFDRFYQGAAGRASGTGSGLGLAIAQRLLDAQHALIEARSERGRGTRMRIVMPVRTVADVASPT